MNFKAGPCQLSIGIIAEVSHLGSLNATGSDDRYLEAINDVVNRLEELEAMPYKLASGT